ncbi:MAG: hypothetical protein INH37_04275 [Myxococcaceae bacterium]|jgi:hypothetical protein|nr:hypothetical protein [Myxococcaceae bacterium]
MQCALGTTCSFGRCEGGFGTGAGVSGSGGGLAGGRPGGGGGTVAVGGGSSGGGTGVGGGSGVGGGAPPCTNGCRLETGVCARAGTSEQNNTRCGNGGAFCAACRTDGECIAGVCVPASTGGGGAGGGGVGPTGGGAACPTLSVGALPGGGYTRLRARYATTARAVYNEAYFSTSTQQVGFELVRAAAGALPLPFSGQFTGANYGDCQACLRFGEQCTFSGSTATGCAREFLAQSGSVTFTAATESASSGQFSGSVSNVVVRQWNFGSDTPVANGACYTIPAASFSASWP